MKYGLMVLMNHDVRSSRGQAAEMLQDQVRQAQQAEAAGFGYYWLAEHHLTGHGGLVPSNSILAAAIATATRRIRIGAAAALLTLHDPVELAEQWAMIDCLSGGRVEFGMGRAYLPFEFALFQRGMDESRGRFEEGYEIISKAWRGEPLDYQGKYRTLSKLPPLTPLPLQSPPPMWVTATMTPESFIWAGTKGCGLLVTPWATGIDMMLPLFQLYSEAYDRAGNPPAGKRIQATTLAVVDENPARAREAMIKAFGVGLRSMGDAMKVAPYSGTSYAAYAAMGSQLQMMTPEMILGAQDRIIAGTPADAWDYVTRLKAKCPLITHVSFACDHGMVGRDAVHRSIELLGKVISEKRAVEI